MGLLAACGGLVWLSFQDPAGQVQRLSGGATLELRGMTYGKHHHWQDGSFARRVSRWCSSAVQTLAFQWPSVAAPANGGFSGVSWLIADDGDRELDTPGDQPVLWIRLRNPTGQRPHSGWLNAATQDSHGCWVRCDQLDWLNMFGFVDRGSSTSFLYQAPLSVYPRREPSFRLQLTDVIDNRYLAGFFILNPCRLVHQQWKAPGCPVQARSGNLRVVLRSLTHASDTGLSTCNPVFEYQEGGRPTRNWRPARVFVSDATGNKLLTDHSYSLQKQKDEFDALCRFETAWKFKVRLMRPHPELAPAEQIRHVRVRAFPRRNSFSPIGASNLKLNSPRVPSTLSFPGEAVFGAGTIRFQNGSYFSDHPSVEVRGWSRAPLRQLSLIRITDARGRRFGLPANTSQLMEGGDRYRFDLPDIPAGTPVNLTFAVHRTRAVEFLVKP